MDEREWLCSTDPQAMLTFLRDSGKLSERKARLFAVACCRRVGHRLRDARSRWALEVAERLADGKVEPEEHRDAWKAALACWGTPAESAVRDAISDQAAEEVAGASRHAAWATGLARMDQELGAQAGLLRDIFGNPFRPVAVDSACLAWSGGLVVAMADRMYETRDFADMPVMADALEEAGCANPEMLSHCRQQGPAHVRGCWVVDRLLARGSPTAG